MEKQDVSDKPISLLLLEDGPEDLELYKRRLKSSAVAFDVSEATSVRQAKELCEKQVFDCYVVDYRLPDADGIEFIKFLTARAGEGGKPAIVMVTGQGSEEIAVEAMKIGASDYITKSNISEGFFVQPLLNAIERATLGRQIKFYQKELERSNRELSAFAHTASHDLKAPVRRILSYCEILAAEATDRLNDDDKAILVRMQANGQRMQQLINDLLTYSFIESEQEERKETDLNAMLKEIVEEFELQISENTAKVKLDKLPTLAVYPLRIRQLFSNLISNALKYRGAEQPVIKVSARRTETGIEFSIQDNGIGIPAEFQEEIFEDFKRLHTYEEIEGTGLGLSICKKITEMHGGKIWVASTPGSGSTFYFTIAA